MIYFCVWFIFKQDLTNLIMLEVYAKIDLNVHVFQKKNWCSSKSDRWFCDSHTLTVRATFRSKDFRWKKKYGGTGLLSQKTEALYVEPNKRAEAAISSYFAAGDFLHGIYSVLVAKNHLKIRLRCSVHEFSFTDIF